jgi:hypothetical protein
VRDAFQRLTADCFGRMIQDRADARVDPAVAGSPTQVYLGVDGVLVPTVTAAEKDRRRADQAVRRQRRSAAGVGNARPLPPARPGTDQRYKEFKIGLFYDQAKRHRHAFATAGDRDRSARCWPSTPPRWGSSGPTGPCR